MDELEKHQYWQHRLKRRWPDLKGDRSTHDAREAEAAQVREDIVKLLRSCDLRWRDCRGNHAVTLWSEPKLSYKYSNISSRINDVELRLVTSGRFDWPRQKEWMRLKSAWTGLHKAYWEDRRANHNAAISTSPSGPFSAR